MKIITYLDKVGYVALITVLLTPLIWLLLAIIGAGVIFALALIMISIIVAIVGTPFGVFSYFMQKANSYARYRG